jgi:predicted nucleic acid-binding protein
VNVVDSSAWLEYFANGPNAGEFAAAIEATGDLVVPTISIFEVFKRILQQVDEGAALKAVALMRQGQVVDLDESIALNAAKLSLDLHLPMADSIILATARRYNAIVWTQDSDFKNIKEAEYRPKQT